MNLRHAPAIQSVKNTLVGLGPNSWIVRLLLKANARLHGFQVSFSGHAIAMRRGKYELDLPLNHFIEVPIMMECFNDFLPGTHR